MPPDEPARAVRRGEGEVTQWPRGLAGYTPRGPADEKPSEEEDRTANRIRLAARLLSLLRAHGRDLPEAVRELAAIERALRAGRREEAGRRVDRLLAELEPAVSPAEHGPRP